jgi:hypothetical protein
LGILWDLFEWEGVPTFVGAFKGGYLMLGQPWVIKENKKEGVWVFNSFCATSWDRLVGRGIELTFC